MSRLQHKALCCLVLAEMHDTPSEWQDFYDSICCQFSEKAVLAKLEELTNRGYVEYGVSARQSWLTEKGEAALAHARIPI